MVSTGGYSISTSADLIVSHEAGAWYSTVTSCAGLLYQIVAEGGSGTADRFYPMPAFGDQLTTEEIEAVLFYIKTYWTEEERQRQAEISDASGN